MATHNLIINTLFVSISNDFNANNDEIQLPISPVCEYNSSIPKFNCFYHAKHAK